jgi:hypothetical protein
MRPLYDTDDFPAEAAFSHFHCNLLRINVLGARNALFAALQFHVKMNTRLSQNVKKACFFDVLVFGALEAAIRETGRRDALVNRQTKFKFAID